MRDSRDFQNERLSQGIRVGLVNLGCARNLVDSQEILGRLGANGYALVDPDQADYVIVNTCGFIEDAKKESIDEILHLVDLKKQGRIKKIIVSGCLAQRYGRELADEIDGIDAIAGVVPFSRDRVPDYRYLAPAHYAYVKICESCYNQCSFCAIPGIKGKFRSRRIETVCEEVRALESRGVKEINLIGQDITAYGMDLYREKSLARLLKELLNEAGNMEWIRLLYAFPAHMTDELIETIASDPRICRYIDIPLQHISERILRDMNRGLNSAETRALIGRLRDRIPGVHLRTSFIVGFPGETDEEFEELCTFVRSVRFERMGAFLYSPEDGTPAAALPGRIPGKIKQQRYDRLMQIQQEMSRERLESRIGNTLRVMIDEPAEDGDGVYCARSEFDAPEVDGLVYVRSERPLIPGDFVTVRVQEATEYDLAGVIE